MSRGFFSCQFSAGDGGMTPYTPSVRVSFKNKIPSFILNPPEGQSPPIALNRLWVPRESPGSVPRIWGHSPAVHSKGPDVRGAEAADPGLWPGELDRAHAQRGPGGLGGGG